jgi:hypothetical protein
MHWPFYFPPTYRGEAKFHAKPIIYIAGPYTNNAPKNHRESASTEKRLARFAATTEVAKKLIERGEIVFSPLTMTHPIDVRMINDPGSAFWVSFDEAFMTHCRRLIVVKLPGWDESSGVKREIEYFAKRGIAPEWHEPAEFGINPSIPEFAAAFQ